ncbi:MAG: DUF3576 domain-containing protein [Phenylobacterium sp.]|uniref:DUF3576 domain-containing protein n=1 Tax=Phenylobacterium sp. TaxID=1871053 RepID=UPI00271E8651|nr:DUF3576 domain-containing protein [Phenylobacterium sp.]MDO8900263.1 DUF3576 domain-containing protein [Phenylobacterium sp.]MDP2215497.1 DUF3576 domain-containing protein [Phenylobacterium sp.]
MPFVRGARFSKVSIAVLALGLVSLSACASRGDGERRGLFGRGQAQSTQTAAISVNGYLWRASLDTLAFMPLVSADPYGGVIITDWYTAPETPNERFKATVYILDARLRADGLNVALFKQIRGADGQWADAAPSAQTEVDLENAILTRARQLRLSNIRG